MLIRRAVATDVDRRAELRAALWPESSVDAHRAEIAAVPDTAAEDHVAFVAVAGDALVGFAEAALRHDYVNGCVTSPVAFLEGIYVHPGRQGSGVGRALSAAVEAWGRDRGCSELASDARLDNVDSHRFHRAIGFEETERVVYFRKRLSRPDRPLA